MVPYNSKGRTRHSAALSFLKSLILYIMCFIVVSNGEDVTGYYTKFDLVRIHLNNDHPSIDVNKRNQLKQVVMSENCLTDLFDAIWIVPTPESNPSLCGVLTNETIEQFRLTFQDNDYQGSTAVLISSSIGKNNNNTTICTIDEMVSNIELINEYPTGTHNITHIIIPYSYAGMTNMGNFTAWWEISDPCSYSSIIGLFVADNETVAIESFFTSLQHDHPKEDGGGNAPSEKFLMMVAEDMNGDGLIDMLDYGEYYGTPASRSSKWRMTSPDNMAIWISLSIVFVALCCFVGNRIRQAKVELQQRPTAQPTTATNANRTAIHEQQSGGNRTAARTRQNHSDNKKHILTDDEFAALPQITYRARKKSSISLFKQANNITVAEDDTTETIAYTKNAAKDKTVNNEKVTEPVFVVQEISASCILPDGRKQREYSTTTIFCNDEEQLDDLNSFKTSQHSIYQKIAKQSSVQSFGTNRVDCCSICLDEFQNREIITALPFCLHLFHTKCIEEWLLVRKHDTCPLCKTAILLEGDSNDV